MPDALTEFLDYADSQRGVPYQWGETKDISSASGGTFTLPAFGSAALSRPGIIATPVENGLRNAARVHNAIHGVDPAKRADVTALRAVYRRGAKAYSKRRHPASSRRRWAMQRVKNHLTMLATGDRPHPRYVHDDDLLPAGHPHAKSTKGERKALLVIEGRRDELGVGVPMPPSVIAVLLEGKGFLAALGSLEVKGVWNPDKHPRDRMGRFIHIGAAVTALIDGKQQDGTVTSVGGGGVTVRTADGAEHAVKAADAQVTDHVGPHMSVAEHVRAHTDADNKARQLEKAGHPEAPAWAQRRDALGEGLRARVAAGESVRDPYTPPSTPGRENLATPEGLHSHLTAPPPQGHGADVAPATGDEGRAQLSATHAGEHQLGADHTHPPADGASQAAAATPAEVPRPGDAPARPDGSAWGSGYAPGDPRSNPAYDQYVANTDAKNDLALEQVGDTATVHDYVEGADGAYQPDRQAMHDAIIDELLERYSGVPKERKAVVLAGPSGAGKSTTIRLLGHEFGVESDAKGNPTNFATLNPDDIKEMMVERGMVDPGAYSPYGLGPQEGMTLIHEESSHITKALREQLIARGHNIIVDGTFNGKLSKKVGEVMLYRGNGYTVTGVLVDGEIDRSLTNAGKRHTKIEGPDGKSVAITPDMTLDTSKPFQGRYVPLTHIEAQRPTGQFSDVLQRPHLSQNAENFEGAKEAFDGGFRIYSNATGEAKLIHSEEPTPSKAHADVRAVSDKHLERLRSGTPSEKISRADSRGMVAAGLVQATQEDRPVYVSESGGGFVVAHAPLSRTGGYYRISPDGLVMRQQGADQQPMPATDVEKLIDHFVKPGAPQTESEPGAGGGFEADPAKYRERTGPLAAGDFVRADGQVHRVTGVTQTDPKDIRTKVIDAEAGDGSTRRLNLRQIDATLEPIDPEADRAAKVQRNLEHNRRVDAARAARKAGGGSPRA